MHRLTVFTPTFNREKTLSRVFDSLNKQTYRDFVWLIIDDGSTDNTAQKVEEFIKCSNFEIKYYYQENMGKHIAVNKAVQLTNTELFIIADSDDGFVDNALEELVYAWDSIPQEDRKQFKGVNCRVFEHETGNPIGPDFPYEEFDSNDEHAYFILKMRSEKWNLLTTESLKEFPFPEIKNAHFYPETVIWQRMAKVYKTRYINKCLREYYKDTENSVTNAPKSVRYVENIHLWTHFVNDEFLFFKYYPKRFIQSLVGIVRDGILNEYNFKKIIGIPNSFLKKLLVVIFFPAGAVLAFLYKRNRH